MAAIIGLGNKEVEEVCSKVQSGFVVPANYNTNRANCNIRRRRSSKRSRKNSTRNGSKKSNVTK